MKAKAQWKAKWKTKCKTCERCGVHTWNDRVEEHVVGLALHDVRVLQVPARAFADAAASRREALRSAIGRSRYTLVGTDTSIRGCIRGRELEREIIAETCSSI